MCQKQATASNQTLRVLFWLDSPIQDLGWGYEHNAARIELEWAMSDRVVTTLDATAPSFDSKESRARLEAIASSGRYDLIVSTGGTSLVQAAERHPDVHFLGVAMIGPTRPNLSNVFGKIEQIRYLTGLLAGLTLSGSGETAAVGYVGSVRISEVYRGINAFYSGMRSVWPQGRLQVVWTNAFDDPDLSAYAAELLIDRHGAALITHHMNDIEPLFRAAERGVPSVGYQSDQGRLTSAQVLTSCVWNWTAVYVNYTQQLLDGAWPSDDVLLPVASGVAALGTWSPLVPAAVRARVDDALQAFLNGSFDVFCGADGDPWRFDDDADTGGCLNQTELFAMDSLYAGVEDLGDVAIPLQAVELSAGLLAAMQTLAALFLAASAVFAALVLYYRRTNVVRYSSPLFCCTMLLGSMLTYSSVFLYSVSPPTDLSCNLSWWLLCVGFGTFYAALLAKTWRVCEIFRELRQLRKRLITDASLFPPLALIVGGELVLLTLFTAVDMPTALAIRRNDDSSLGVYQYRVVCDQTVASQAVLIALLVYNGLLLAVGVFFSFQTRTLSRTFNESRHIAIGIYAFAVMLAICSPLLGVSNDWTSRYWITCLGVIISTATAVGALFVPKFLVIALGKDASFDPMNNESSTTASS